MESGYGAVFGSRYCSSGTYLNENWSSGQTGDDYVKSRYEVKCSYDAVNCVSVVKFGLSLLVEVGLMP